jgi:3-isopropylmalate/(R)-2-methylmalate dehydratase large subunit
MAMARTLFDKIWGAHVVTTREDGQALLAVDRHYVHEGSFHGFGMPDHAGRRLRRPDLTFAVNDHYAPSARRPGSVIDPELAHMMGQLRDNARRHAIPLLDLDDPAQGIVHVAFPEQKRPRTMRVVVEGRLGAHVAGKDLILAIIARIGAAGAVGHVLEYAGPAIRALPMEGRMTVCNRSIEAGGRAGKW